MKLLPLVFIALVLFSPLRAQGVLRSDIPDIDAKPDTSGINYTFESLALLDKWKVKYEAACLMVFPDAVAKPMYSFDGAGSSTAFVIVPLHRVPGYGPLIREGKAKWCFLGDAFIALKTPPPTPTPPVDSTQLIELARLRSVLEQVRLLLRNS